MQIYQSAEDALLRSQHRDPLLRHLTRSLVDLAGRLAPPSPELPAIDIGCGVGRTSLALAAAGYPVLGVDPSDRTVRLATMAAAEAGLAGRAAFYVGDATAAPPEAWLAGFGLAVCSEVIEHVKEPERVLAYAWDVLRPGGILLLTTPHDPSQWTAMDAYAGHVNRFSRADMDRLLAGWQVLDLGTEGFPFQRTLMQGYDAVLRRRGQDHRFESFGESPAYRLYTALMPWLLKADHLTRRLKLGTTWVIAARRA